jgi:heme oxygenase
MPCLDVALLVRIGEALYGPLWQSALARSIGVSDRTMRRWVAGERAIAATVWPEFLELLEERDTEIAELEAVLTVALEARSAP